MVRALLLLAALGLAVFPPGATASSVPRTVECWNGTTAYPYPYTRHGYRTERFVNATPDCRQADRGTPDFTPDRGFTAYGSMRPAPYSLQLEPPRPQSPWAPRTWPLADSFGHTFALLSQQRLPEPFGPLHRGRAGDALRRAGTVSDRWTIRYPDGRLYGSTAAPGMRLLIQGRACMTTDQLENRYAFVVLLTGADAYGVGPRAFGVQAHPGPVYMGIRGFLPVQALPERGVVDPRSRFRKFSTRQLVAYYSIGCNLFDTTTFAAPSPPERKVHGSLVPLFDWNDRYDGHGTDATNPGSRLSNYQGWPDPSQAKPPASFGPVPPSARGSPGIVRVVKLMQSTTAVEGGGIVRAIVPANARFVELDHFDYVDPNVLCADVGRGRVQSGQVARWMYVRIAGTRIEGWVPWRATPRVVSCPKGGAGQAPPRG